MQVSVEDKVEENQRESIKVNEQPRQNQSK